MRVIATSPVHAARYYAVVRPTHLSEGAGPEKKGARLDKKKEAWPERREALPGKEQPAWLSRQAW